jgi:hypothetical protein
MWKTLVLITLALWLGGSLLLDTVLMPIFYVSGMMTEPGFATTGYSMFWVFNRIELVCAALVLTGAFVRYFQQKIVGYPSQQLMILSALMLDLALIYTYGLTPHMSALGVQLNLFNPAVEPPALMNVLHTSYWFLEVLKLAIGGWLITLWYRSANHDLALGSISAT